MDGSPSVIHHDQRVLPIAVVSGNGSSVSKPELSVQPDRRIVVLPNLQFNGVYPSQPEICECPLEQRRADAVSSMVGVDGKIFHVPDRSAVVWHRISDDVADDRSVPFGHEKAGSIKEPLERPKRPRLRKRRLLNAKHCEQIRPLGFADGELGSWNDRCHSSSYATW